MVVVRIARPFALSHRGGEVLQDLRRAGGILQEPPVTEALEKGHLRAGPLG